QTKGKFHNQGGVSLKTIKVTGSFPTLHASLILLAAAQSGDQDSKMSCKKSPEELKRIFEKYAAKEGDPDQLSKDELKLLIQTEFPTLLKGSSTIDDLFKELDKNGDGEVSFEEFQVLVKKISQ
ncbi:hypothetical protein H1C71_029964, partial [Ictidomys tridecemlineatus]